MARIRLDHAGIAEVLTSAKVAASIAALAEAVAAEARQDEAVKRHEARVDVTEYETDRSAASVTIAHPGGLGIEAKHGTLTRAAGASGLEVRSRE